MESPAPSLCRIIDALAREGEAPALIEVAAEVRTHSRDALLRKARSLAAGLIEAGIRRGEVVALLADNRAEWIMCALGVIRAGAVILPIDSQMGTANLRHILEDSGARIIFTNGEQRERLIALGLATLPRLARLDQSEGEEAWTRLCAAGDASLPEAAPEDLAILFYTSGTTGPPKGVPLSHANILFQLQAVEAVKLVHERDRLLLPLPLHHVYPFVIGMLTPLSLGVPIVLPRALTGPEILRAIREGDVSVILGVPRLYRALYTGIASQVAQKGPAAKLYFHAARSVGALGRRLGFAWGRRLLAPVHRQFGPHLRLLASGGSALNTELAHNLEALGWDIAIGYGLTETSPLLTLNLPGSGALDTVGKALPGVELRLAPVDLGGGDGGGERLPGGEVQARGPGIFKGYWKLPELQEKAFTEDGWFRTGDLGTLDPRGFLTLQGRASTVIVTESGKNIQPDEVEEHYAAHPWIAEIGLLGVEGRLMAVIIPDSAAMRQAGRGEDEALKVAVAEQSKKLPSYQRLNGFVTSREALPRTRLGKIQRHRLTECYRQAVAATEQGTRAQAGPLDLEDMSDQDRELVCQPQARAVWDWLATRYPEARLTPDTSPYHDLNIDSIEMINLTLEIKRLTGVELPEKALSRIETLRDLLHEVVHQAESGEGGLQFDRILAEPEPYLSPEQQRWLHPLSPLVSLVPRAGRVVLRALLKLFFRFKVEGLEHVPPGPCVLAPNHESFLDPVLLFAALPYGRLRRTYFAGWTGMIFKNAAWRVIARLGQTIPVDPRHAAASSLALGAKVLKNGDTLIWFPEGERSRDGRLKPFKPGIGLLLGHYRVPAVPVGIEGAHEALPRDSARLRLHPLRVRFGPPLAVDAALAGEGAEAVSSALRTRVAALLDTRND